MFSHNLPDENGGQVTPQCSLNYFQALENISDSHKIWELGLQGGKELSKYYLDLVKIYLHQQDVKLNTQVFNLKKRQERHEIEEYTKNFQKQQ
jgi:hypothetical protein